MNSISPARRQILNVLSLEDRATPASAVYTAATQTLTITAAEGDRLVVAAVAKQPVGYITLTETQAAVNVFKGDATNQGVRNLIVKFGSVQNGDFLLDSSAKLGGNLTIVGAKSTQSVTLFGTVGGNVTYTAAPAPATTSDQFNVEPTTVIGGNLSLNLGKGSNTTRLKGGTIRGNLTLVGLSGTDRVEITDSADINVGMAASFNLGDGTNTVIGLGTHLMRVGGNFNYMGGTGNDTFNLDSSGAGLTAGIDARFVLGTPLAYDSNAVSIELLSANRNIAFIGGAGLDTIESSGLLSAGGNLTANLGNGDNSFNSNQGGIGTNTIGSNFTYVGGMNGDTVLLDNTTIGRNVSVALGDAVAGANSSFAAGTQAPGPVTVYGNVKIVDGPKDSGIFLQRMFVGGSLTVLGGSGNDNLIVDDTQVAG
ncbi:MAG TPA: hypothetical protein VHR66_19120, partial [Gemmataceae bacterium]|nr:hypothetical protein [Gemmataceae bacterium]